MPLRTNGHNILFKRECVAHSREDHLVVPELASPPLRRSVLVGSNLKQIVRRNQPASMKISGMSYTDGHRVWRRCVIRLA